MKQVFTPEAPPPNGHYSQAVATEDRVYLSNQLPLLPDGSGRMPEGAAAQARQAIANCRAILAAVGGDLRDVVTATIQVTDMAAWPQVDAVWAEAFGDHKPARAVGAVAQLHLGALVAVQMTALRRPSRSV